MIMIFFILFLFITSLALGISILSKKAMKYTIPFSLFSIILFMYILGIVIPLNIAFYLLLVAYFIIVGLGLFKSRSNLKKTIKKYCKDGTLLLYFLLFLVFALFNFDKHVAYIDEYNHWASVVKAMFSSNNLSFKMDYLMYPSYPPAISLLQYTMMKLAGNFHESILYLSFYLFGSSLFLPFIKLKRKNFILNLAFILLGPTILFLNYYNCIYVDGLIGILFAHTMIYLFVTSKKEIGNFEYIYIAFSLIVLTLLKDIGFIFSLIAVIYLGICLKLSKNKFWKKYIIILGCVFLARISWSTLLFIFETPLKHQNIIGYKDFVNLITFNPSEIQLQIINQFIQNIVNLKVIDEPINLHYYGVVVVLSMIFYLIYISDIKMDRKKFRYLCIFMIGGMTIYPLLLLGTYLFQFDYFEAIRLSSYERYIVIFINSILIAIILWNLYFNNYKTLVISCCLLLLFVPINQFPNWINQRDEPKDWTKITNYALENKVLIYDYEMLDPEISKIKYEIGYSKKEVIENIKILNNNVGLDIKNYNYIYFINADTNIKKDLNVDDNSLYKVNKDKNSVTKINTIN